MLRIACLWIPHFLAEVELRRHKVNGRPLIVRDGTRVLDACPRASEAGVHSEDPFHQALSRCPAAYVVEADRVHYQSVWDHILEILNAHSPLVEGLEWGVAYLDARGLEPLYESPASWCQTIRSQIDQDARMKAYIGVAGSKFAAWIAARSSASQPGYFMVEKDDRAYLASFPVDDLPLSDNARRRLHLLGMHRIGQFARLSRTAVAEQFGPENLEAHLWARGQDRRPLSERRCQIFQVHHEFDVPESRCAPILDAILAKSRSSLDYIRLNGLAVQRVSLKLCLDCGQWLERSAWVGGAMGPEKLESVLGGMLHSLGGDERGVVEIQLQLVGLEPAVERQLNLFAYAEGRLRLEKTLRKLTRKYPPSCMVRVHANVRNAPLAEQRYGLSELSL